jgi:hypothetical protein
MYDPKTRTTINGVVQEAKEIAGPGKGTGTHLTIKSRDAVYSVHVGPTWYLTQKNYTFAKGDHVEVVGSKVNHQGGRCHHRLQHLLDCGRASCSV